MSRATVVFYNVINDKEDKTSQNVFYISKPLNSITLSDVKREFPLVGTYHFRFKIIHNNNAAWVDITDDASAVPNLNACIYAKVLRLSWLEEKGEGTSRTGEGEPGGTGDRREEPGPDGKGDYDPVGHEDTRERTRPNQSNSFDSSDKNSHFLNEQNKSKNTIDMLLFETTPNSATTNTNKNKNKRKEGMKDQNYLDLMFN